MDSSRKNLQPEKLAGKAGDVIIQQIVKMSTKYSPSTPILPLRDSLFIPPPLDMGGGGITNGPSAKVT